MFTVQNIVRKQIRQKEITRAFKSDYLLATATVAVRLQLRLRGEGERDRLDPRLQRPRSKSRQISFANRLPPPLPPYPPPPNGRLVPLGGRAREMSLYSNIGILGFHACFASFGKSACLSSLATSERVRSIDMQTISLDRMSAEG